MKTREFFTIGSIVLAAIGVIVTLGSYLSDSSTASMTEVKNEESSTEDKS